MAHKPSIIFADGHFYAGVNYTGLIKVSGNYNQGGIGFCVYSSNGNLQKNFYSNHSTTILLYSRIFVGCNNTIWVLGLCWDWSWYVKIGYKSFTKNSWSSWSSEIANFLNPVSANFTNSETIILWTYATKQQYNGDL